MRPHIIRYRIRPEAREEHERLLGELVTELVASPVAGLRYEAFRIGDALEYLHLVTYDKVGNGPLRRPPALARFHDTLRERCDGVPRRDELEPVRADVSEASGDDARHHGGHHDHWRHLHG